MYVIHSGLSVRPNASYNGLKNQMLCIDSSNVMTPHSFSCMLYAVCSLLIIVKYFAYNLSLALNKSIIDFDNEHKSTMYIDGTRNKITYE